MLDKTKAQREVKDDAGVAGHCGRSGLHAFPRPQDTPASPSHRSLQRSKLPSRCLKGKPGRRFTDKQTELGSVSQSEASEPLDQCWWKMELHRDPQETVFGCPSCGVVCAPLALGTSGALRAPEPPAPVLCGHTQCTATSEAGGSESPPSGLLLRADFPPSRRAGRAPFLERPCSHRAFRIARLPGRSLDPSALGCIGQLVGTWARVCSEESYGCRGGNMEMRRGEGGCVWSDGGSAASPHPRACRLLQGCMGVQTGATQTGLALREV